MSVNMEIFAQRSYWFPIGTEMFLYVLDGAPRHERRTMKRIWEVTSLGVLVYDVPQTTIDPEPTIAEEHRQPVPRNDWSAKQRIDI